MLSLIKSTVLIRKLVLPVTSIATSSAINKMETISSDKMKSTLRLTPLVRPVNYNLKLHPNLKVGTFTGSVHILINVMENSSNLTLHSKGLLIKDVSVTKSNKAVAVSRFCEDKELEQLRIDTKECLTPGDYCLSIEFSSDLKNKIVGFYSSEYKDSVMVSSKFQPTYARQAFPCFDEPDFKAPFDITLVKPAGYVALSNMNEISSVHDSATNTDTVSFATSVPMSTYLACFVLCEFAYKEVEINTHGVGNNFKLRAYAQKEELHKIDFALDIAKRATEFYINYYQVPYPLPKLDMIAIPNYISGATEHWGLVTFRETSFLLDQQTASSSNKLAVAHTVAHELAHMWFGNLVTMKWWDDIWLNEGFASYMEVKSLDSLQPTWTMLEQFLTSKLHPVLQLDGTLSSHPIVQTVATPDQITAIFDTISYSKGSSLLRMLEGFVGAENFRRGVTAYLNKYKFGNSVTADLFHVLEPYMQEQHGLSVSRVMSSWSLQMGYPVLSVRPASTAPGDLRYLVTQTRFLNEPGADTHTDELTSYRWYVPITYKTNLGESKKILWFPDTEKSVSITLESGSKWLKLNNEQVGYYRVNYTEDMWEELSVALRNKDPQLSISERAHLLSDALSLASAAMLPYSTALHLATCLREETQLVPWDAAELLFNKLDKLLRGTDASEHFKKYVQYLILPLYKQISWEPSKLSVIEGLFRTKLLSLALRYSLGDALEQVRRVFAEWLAAPHAVQLEPDLRGIVYTYGIALSTPAEWEQVWQMYLAESDAQEKAKLRNALAASRDTHVLHRYLTLAWDERHVRSQDYLGVVQAVSSSEEGARVAWGSVRARWPDLVARFTLNSRYLGGLVPALTSAFASEDRLKELESFFSQYPEGGAGARGRLRAREELQSNIAWRRRNLASVHRWLQAFTQQLALSTSH